MAVIKFSKVIGTVPPVLEPNTAYLVRTGAGFDLFMTDMTGTVAHTLNSSGGDVFLRDPDEVDDTDETYFYWGWTDIESGSWKVRRTVRSNASKTNATIVNNNVYVDLASAWPNRATLAYV